MKGRTLKPSYQPKTKAKRKIDNRSNKLTKMEAKYLYWFLHCEQMRVSGKFLERLIDKLVRIKRGKANNRTKVC